MTPIEEMTDEQFEKHTLDILARELGPLGVARYLRMHGEGTGDYTRDRHNWLGRLSVEQIIEEAKRLEAEGSGLR
jgi:hypothetical protein